MRLRCFKSFQAPHFSQRYPVTVTGIVSTPCQHLSLDGDGIVALHFRQSVFTFFIFAFADSRNQVFDLVVQACDAPDSGLGIFFDYFVARVAVGLSNNWAAYFYYVFMFALFLKRQQP